MSTLTQQKIDNAVSDMGAIEKFVNDPAGSSPFTTRLGRQSKNIAALSTEVLAMTANLVAPGIRVAFESSTTMGAPSAGGIRFNNATIASATAIAFSNRTVDTGNPDVSDFIAQWGASTSTTLRGTLVIRKIGAPQTFAVFNITSAVTDNTTWLQATVAYVAGSGTLSAADQLSVQWSRTGNKGDIGLAPGGTYNVVDYGADPTGVADSTTVIQNAINAAQATGYGGIVYFPPGLYRSGPLTVGAAPVFIQGSGRLVTQIKGLTATQNSITVTNCVSFGIDGVSTFGPDSTVMTGGVTLTLIGTQGGRITNNYFANCWVPLSLTSSTNNLIAFNKIDNVFGPEWVNFGSGGGGNYFHDNQLDQSWFTNAVFTYGVSGTARARNTAYVDGDIRSFDGYYFRCCVAGTSSNSTDPVKSYFPSSPAAGILDGTCRWAMLGKTDAVLVAQTAAVQNYIHDNDFTSFVQYLITIDGCDGTQINHNQGGGSVTGFIRFSGTNSNVTIDDNYFSESLGFGFVQGSGTSDRLMISNNKLINMADTALLLAGVYLKADNNIIYQSGRAVNAAAVLFNPNATNFSCIGNTIRKGAGQTTAAMIQVATGTSDFYDISHNVGDGFSTVVSDAGAGTHKTIASNW